MDETRLKRIRFRAWRRGFREADLILGPFSDRYAPDFSDEEAAEFEALLSELDHDIYDWISGKKEPPAKFATPLMERLRDFQRSLPIAKGDLSGS